MVEMWEVWANTVDEKEKNVENNRGLSYSNTGCGVASDLQDMF